MIPRQRNPERNRMMADELKTDPIAALRNRGDARADTCWVENDPDYVNEYGLTGDHIPELIALATDWVNDTPDDGSAYGPVHAWRALGQLRAVDAIQPLLDIQDTLDAIGDDWYLEEFHDVFGLIGATAVEPLAVYLEDDAHGERRYSGRPRHRARRQPVRYRAGQHGPALQL